MKRLFGLLHTWITFIFAALVFSFQLTVTLINYRWMTLVVFPVTILVGSVIVIMIILIVLYVLDITKNQFINPIAWIKKQMDM